MAEPRDPRRDAERRAEPWAARTTVTGDLADVARTIAENATLALFMMDARQHCTYMNVAAERMTGFTLAEVLERDEPLHDIIHHKHPDGRHYPLEECPIDRALPTRAREQGEDVFVHKDGTFYPVAFTASPIVEDGKPVGTIIEVRDLTTERAAQAALRASDARYRFLAESIPSHAWSSDPAGKLDFVSELTARYFGVSAARLLEDGWRDVVHPDDLPGVVERWTRSLATGEPYDVEFRLRRHDGAYRWHLGRALAQRDEHGAIRGWFGTNTDIDDRKRADLERERLSRAVELERQRLWTVLQQAPAVIAVYRAPDLVVEMANPHWEQFTGRRDAVGRRFEELFPESVGSEAHRELERAARTGEVVVGTEVLVPIDRRGTGTPDETFWNYVVQPVRDLDGKVELVLTHAVEVTEQVRARRESERRANELAALSAALRRTNQELDQFAYVASHDLKAPLRGIANLATWIEEDLGEHLGGASREHIELLKGRVQRMEALIDGILLYSRAGRTRGESRTIEVERLVRAAIELLAPPATTTVDVVAPMPTIESEEIPLQQVVMNLVGNAIKHGRHGGRVEIRVRDDGGPFVELVVTDDGPGIAPEYHERIWGIFQTLAARDDVEGAGIGLSVVRKIVESRGGRAWVDSRAGEGAAFHVLWPRTANGVSPSVREAAE